jgi:hypothetical protein
VPRLVLSLECHPFQFINLLFERRDSPVAFHLALSAFFIAARNQPIVRSDGASFLARYLDRQLSLIPNLAAA